MVCQGKSAGRLRGIGFLALLACATLPAGCARTNTFQQWLVNKPNMRFSDSLIFSCQGRLLSQSEPGAMTSGGAPAAGCSSCR